MKETFLPSSTNVAKIDYDGDTQELVVAFRSGGVYRHRSVPQAVFLGLQNAASVGSYYHRQVKGRYVTEQD